MVVYQVEVIFQGGGSVARCGCFKLVFEVLNNVIYCKIVDIFSLIFFFQKKGHFLYMNVLNSEFLIFPKACQQSSFPCPHVFIKGEIWTQRQTRLEGKWYEKTWRQGKDDCWQAFGKIKNSLLSTFIYRKCPFFWKKKMSEKISTILQ